MALYKQTKLIGIEDRVRDCPLCKAQVAISRLTCPHCRGRVYTELVRQESENCKNDSLNVARQWPFSDPPELRGDSPYILCEAGTTAKYTFRNKIHIMVCITKCKRIFKCESLQRGLSEKGMEQFNSALEAVKKAGKGEDRQAKIVPLSQRRRPFITVKKTDWRDIRKAVENGILDEYRKSRKMNPASMAKKLEISLPRYQRLEKGNAPRIQRQLIPWIEGKIAVQEKNKSVPLKKRVINS